MSAQLVIVNGNVCDAPHALIMHGCNAQGVMGSGVAKAIRAKFPLAYTDYRLLYEAGDLYPGYVHFCRIYEPEAKTIANIITQEYYGNDGGKYARYEHLMEGLKRVRSYCLTMQITEIATPWIGCGLGGLKQEIVQELLEEMLVEKEISVYIYKY